MFYYNMNDTTKVGDEGVGVVKAALLKNKPANSFVKIEKAPPRADFSLKLIARKSLVHNLTKRLIAVKTDRRDNGNIFIELMSNEESGQIGCFLSTDAHYLFYFIQPTRKLHIFPVPLLKEWIKENHMGFESKSVKTPTGDSCFTTSGIPVPKHYLKHINLNISGFYEQIFSDKKQSFDYDLD